MKQGRAHLHKAVAFILALNGNSIERTIGARGLPCLAVLGLPWLVALAFFLYWGQVQLTGESPCYVSWCDRNPAVYPSFVWVLGQPLLLPVQLALFAASVTWVGWLLFRQFQPWVGTLAVMGLIANPYVWVLQGSVMSEALTTPLMILIIGCVLLYLSKGNFAWLLVAFFAAGLSVGARPSTLCMALIPILAIWIGKPPGNRRPRLLSTIVGMAIWLVPLIVERSVTQSVLGEGRTSLLGRHVIGKASVIEAGPIERVGLSPLESRVAHMMEQQYEPVRAVIRPLGGSVRDIVRFNYEVCIQYQCTDIALADIHPIDRPTLDAALLKIGFRRLALNPSAYLDLAIAEYKGLWSLHTRKHPNIARRYNAFLSENMPLPFQRQLGHEGMIVPVSDQKYYYRYDRIVMFALAIAIPIAILALLLALVEGDQQPMVVTAFAALVGLEAILMFIALVGVGIPRYTLGLWPGIVLGLGLALAYFVDQVRARSRRR